MWFRIKYSCDITGETGKPVHTMMYYLTDCGNFAEAGYKALEYNNGQGEIEDVCLMKSYKPLGNERYGDDNKVYIVKFAQDFTDDSDKIKTVKYPVPFFADNSKDLQGIVDRYIAQGLDDMRMTTISETKWEIID